MKSGKKVKYGIGREECGIRYVSVSCDKLEDYSNPKESRTIYAVGELKALYGVVEGINKKYGENDWGGNIQFSLFKAGDDGSSICLVRKTGYLEVDKATDIFHYAFLFEPSDFGKEMFEEGTYAIAVQLGNVIKESDLLFFMEGNGIPESYLKIREVSIDRAREELEPEKPVRCLRELDRRQLKDVCFYFLAENLLKQLWIYEFFIRLEDQNGRIRAVKTVRQKQYMPDFDGHMLLCWALDLGNGVADFWIPGNYTLRVFCFGKQLLSLDFKIGENDIPCDYTADIAGTETSSSPVGISLRLEPILDRLYALVGLRKVKEEILQISEYIEFISLRRKNGFNDELPLLHVLFTGNPGIGENTVAHVLGEMASYFGLLSHGKVKCYEWRDLIQGENTEQWLRKIITDNTGGIIFMGDIAELCDECSIHPAGGFLLGLLVNILTEEKPEVLFIVRDPYGKSELFRKFIPHWKDCFTKSLCFENYTEEELMQIARNKLEKKQLCLTPAAADKFFRILKEKCAEDPEQVNGGFIDEQIEEMTLRMAGRLMNNRGTIRGREDMMTIYDDDVVVKGKEEREGPLKKLEAMLKVEPLKQSIIHHLNYIYFIRERHKHGFEDAMPSLNMIFTGNPGTGKLTVAKMLGEIYYSEGILDEPNVCIQNGHSLAIENGVNPEQTAAALLNATEGGVLYVEEACGLMHTATGLGIFSTLLASLSLDEYSGRVVILADNAEEMNKMLEANPGIKEYFPFRFNFRDYTPEELMAIAVDKLKSKNYVFHPKAEAAFKRIVEKVYPGRDKHFGNALWVEKLVEMIIRKMSGRLMKIRRNRELTLKEVSTVMLADIPEENEKIPGFKKESFDEKEIKAALKDMDKLVGQEKIKKQIRDFTDLARHYCNSGIKLSTRMSLQWCFTGNTGMGKKALAGIIARLYKGMGIIKRAEVVHFKVERLIGQLEDEAQRSIHDILVEAEGGILLFDEDSVQVAESEGLRERIRAILVNQMAENPGACMLIYAGQRPTVQHFKRDVENMSDIINILYFEDYTEAELMEILIRKLADEGMKMTSSACQHMACFIERVTATEERKHSSARLIKMTAEWMIRFCEQRAYKNGKKEKSPLSVKKSDVAMFNEEMIVQWMNERKRIGFVRN